MQVTLKAAFTQKDGIKHLAGDSVDLPPDIARRLIDTGLARTVRAKPEKSQKTEKKTEKEDNKVPTQQ